MQLFRLGVGDPAHTDLREQPKEQNIAKIMLIGAWVSQGLQALVRSGRKIVCVDQLPAPSVSDSKKSQPQWGFNPWLLPTANTVIDWWCD